MSIFTKIINREIPSSIVLENEEFIAFKDIAPKAKIHILVVPKIEVLDFDSASGELIGKIGTFTQEVARHLGIKNGYRIITNIGQDGNQEVKHLHFHLLAGENLGDIRG